MGLQINPTTREELPGAPPPDDWGTKIGKLIPAEALGLYGSAAALVPATSKQHDMALWTVVAVACLILVIIRYRSARDPITKRVQIGAILISLVSFFLWLLAIGKPTSPFGLSQDLAFVGPLAALLWGTAVPYVYNGQV